MATIKYRKRELSPNQNQQGMSHCWYVESVIVNELDTVELARLIEARWANKKVHFTLMMSRMSVV